MSSNRFSRAAKEFELSSSLVNLQLNLVAYASSRLALSGFSKTFSRSRFGEVWIDPTVIFRVKITSEVELRSLLKVELLYFGVIQLKTLYFSVQMYNR